VTNTPQATEAIGLTLIALAAAAAGFLTADAANPEPTPPANVAPGQAQLLDPAPERLTVTNEGTSPGRVLLFSATGDYDRMQRIAPGNTTQLELGDASAALLLVPRASAPLTIAPPASDDLEPVPTEETRHELLAREGPVDEEITLELPQRPASLTVAVDGEAEDLEVVVRTSEGPALRQVNATTEPGRRGEVRLEPAYLTNGTYRVTVRADALNGQLTLVARTFADEEALATFEVPRSVDALGEPLARVGAGEAWRLDTAELDEVRLALERGGRAQLRVYDAEDRMQRQVEIGDEGPSWQWSPNGSSPASYRSGELAVPEDTHTLYAETVDADTDATVYVLAPGTDAEPGRQLEIRETTATVPYPSPEGREQVDVRYAGGLVDVRLGDANGAAAERRIAVDSPRGHVYERDDRSVEGQSLEGDALESVERFGPGPLTATVEARGATGSVQLVFEHFAP
jgi:hypothetical protein